MALPKAVRCIVVLLVIFYSLGSERCAQSLNIFFEESMVTEAYPIHNRYRRQASNNFTDIEIEAVINTSDLESLRSVLNNFTFPLVLVNNTGVITSIDITTVCSWNMTEYQCICEDSYAWSYNKCISHGACDAITGDTCGCINARPEDGQYCQPKINQNEPVYLDIVLDLSVTVSSVPSGFIDEFKNTLRNVSFPLPVTQDLEIIYLNFTTWCFPDSSGGLQCQCEDGFVWSCDMCEVYGSCSDATTQTCDCIKGLPPSGQFCEPITSNSTCPPNEPVYLDIVLDLSVTVSSVPSGFIDEFKNTLRNISFPLPVTQDLEIIYLNFTTWCFPDSSGGLQCQCEDGFVWSCDMCKVYGSCSDATTQTCDCIKGLPPSGQFCEPITKPVYLDIVLDLSVTVSSVPSGFIDEFKNTLRNVSFPLPVTQDLEIIYLNFTTWCFPDSSGGLQCQCEDGFVWSCDMCKVYGSCSDATTQTCDCIKGLPPSGQFCEPITSNSTCPSNDPVDIKITFDLRIPEFSVPTNFPDEFMAFLQTLSFPQRITQSLTLTALNFTTGCNPNSSGRHDCQCEKNFTWSCDKCEVYGRCSDTSSETCDCINKLPPNGTLCEPEQGIPPCSQTTTIAPNTTTVSTNTTTIAPNTTTVSTNTTTMAPNTTTVSTTTTMAPNTTTVSTMTTMAPNTTTVSTTTTMAPTTTTVSTNTTTMAPTTTTMTSPTTTMAPTTTTTMAPTTTTGTQEVKILIITLNEEYLESYNNSNSPFYREMEAEIKNQAKAHIPNGEANIVSVDPGSVVVTYQVSAPSIESEEVEILQIQLFLKLSENYSVIYEGTPLNVRKPIFLGTDLNLTCDLPEAFFDYFKPNWTVALLQDGAEKIKFNDVNDVNITLNVPNSGPSDTGNYECRLIMGNKIYRKSAEERIIVESKPQIFVNHISRYVDCSKTVTSILTLSCSAEVYNATLINESGVPVGNEVEINIPENCTNESKKTFICETQTSPPFRQNVTFFFITAVGCNETDEFPPTGENQTVTVPCEANFDGEESATCSGGKFGNRSDNCILRVIKELLDQSERLKVEEIPGILNRLSDVTVSNKSSIVNSSATIRAIVTILHNVGNTAFSANASISINSTKDTLETVDVLTLDEAEDQWDSLNTQPQFSDNNTTEAENETEIKSVSSLLLDALENIMKRIINESFAINTSSTSLNKTTFSENFSSNFDSVALDILEAEGENETLTVITFSSMDNVLPARNKENSLATVINAIVVLVQSTGSVRNVTFTFDRRNESLRNPECVFWNFSLFGGLGGWDDEGCEFLTSTNETVTCSCNHLTSFSMLMSPYKPPLFLDWITYVGLIISVISLIICLIIEAIVWRKIRRNNTSYLRHVSIVNIAVSLLIADIWFFIGAGISEAEEPSPPACTAAAFFIHLFYLALFFWMLASALLLLYRTVSVFGGGLSKMSMMAIGFSLGYGAPLIIATITIAVTKPSKEYLPRNGVCWLNFQQSYALLAFVIPALLIVLINFIILVMVLYKIVRRRVNPNAAQAGEKHVLLVIARSLAVLTPLFGLTWSLGIGTMVDPKNIGIHVTFSIFNSLQGFFVLVFGTLLDKKVLSEITIKSQTSRSGTGSTSAGSSSTFRDFFRRKRRDGYHASSTGSGDQSYSNT
ncbi:uncharacterized protein KZ484_013666 isoform 2-T3 [Pholidichthys leucotaenia]